MPANDPDVRRAIAAAAGRVRMATADPVQMLAQRRRAAAAIHTPAALARRIVKAWPDLSRAQRIEVRQILEQIAVRR